jgi:hypothetical protein
VLCTGRQLDGDCVTSSSLNINCAGSGRYFHSADNHSTRPEWLFTGHHCTGSPRLLPARGAVRDFPIGGNAGV